MVREPAKEPAFGSSMSYSVTTSGSAFFMPVILVSVTTAPSGKRFFIPSSSAFLVAASSSLKLRSRRTSASCPL